MRRMRRKLSYSQGKESKREKNKIRESVRGAGSLATHATRFRVVIFWRYLTTTQQKECTQRKYFFVFGDM